jgi:hypothetical protein
MSGALAAAEVTSFQNTPTKFMLGPILFGGIEVPERLGSLGGTQVVAAHDFPGGFRSIQTYGAFADPIKWKGILSGSQALQRSYEIDRIRSSGARVPLIYGQNSWIGVVTSYKATPRFQWLVDYEISYLPQFDTGGAATPPTAPFSAENLLNDYIVTLQTYGAVVSGVSAELAAPLTFAAQVPPQLLAPVLGVVNQAIATVLAIPEEIQAEAAAVVTAAQTALQNAVGGAIANILPADVINFTSAVAAWTTAAAVSLASLDPVIAGPTLMANALITGMSGLILEASSQNAFQVRLINPNLCLLAMQYYGDASQWDIIASENGLLDPFPLGLYDIIIPGAS